MALQHARLLWREAEAVALAVKRVDAGEQSGVHPHLVPVRRGAGRDVALDREQLVVAVGADELAEHVVDALQGAAGVLQRDDGVVEGRRRLLPSDRGDLGLVLGERALVGRHEMLGLDARKRRRAERRGPGLKERIFRRADGWPVRRCHARIVPSSRFSTSHKRTMRRREHGLVHIERQAGFGRCRREHPAALGHPRSRRVDRHEIRLRRRPVRRLHGASRRQGGALLPDASLRGGGQEGRHHRGPVAELLASAAEGLGGAGGSAVRLLPVRPDHEGGRAAGEQQEAEPRADRRSTWTATSAAAAPITASSPRSNKRRGRAEP